MLLRGCPVSFTHRLCVSLGRSSAVVPSAPGQGSGWTLPVDCPLWTRLGCGDLTSGCKPKHAVQTWGRVQCGRGLTGAPLDANQLGEGWDGIERQAWHSAAANFILTQDRLGWFWHMVVAADVPKLGTAPRGHGGEQALCCSSSRGWAAPPLAPRSLLAPPSFRSSAFRGSSVPLRSEPTSCPGPDSH